MSVETNPIIFMDTSVDNSVTIIIATYIRYEALNLSLQSVYSQTYTNWKVLIIADCCDAEFISNVDLSNEKVQLINLPQRCGNQYGSNSVGIHLAQSQYIAFLNHDDLWLSDHLEIAIKTMKEKKADFFLGKAAFCHSKNQDICLEKKGHLMFSEINSPEAIWRCLSGPNSLFEPASSWVVKTELAKKIGYWMPPGKISTTPVLNWLQRAAKQNAVFCFSNQLSVLKINLHQITNGNLPLYSSSEKYLDQLKKIIGSRPEFLREQVKNDILEAKEMQLITRVELENDCTKGPEEEILKKKYLEFIESSINIEEDEGETKRMETFMLSTLSSRTGEVINKFPDIEALIDQMNFKIISHA